jgi:hypothetical protein
VAPSKKEGEQKQEQGKELLEEEELLGRVAALKSYKANSTTSSPSSWCSNCAALTTV